MGKKPKEPVEKICDYCGEPFKTRYPTRARFHPGSKCRSAYWAEHHRVRDMEEFAHEARREYWREEWKRNGRARRARRKERAKVKVLSPSNADALLADLKERLKGAGAEGLSLKGMEAVDAYLCGLLGIEGLVALETRGAEQFVVWLKRRASKPPVFREGRAVAQ